MNTLKTDKQLREEFYKECVFSHPGDSGPGGNTPQEPECYINVEPEDVWNFIKFLRAQDRTTLLEGLLKEVGEDTELPKIPEGDSLAEFPKSFVLMGMNEERAIIRSLISSHLGGDNEIQK